MQDFTQPPYQSYAQAQELARTQEAVFFQKIYFWMCAALAVTAATGYALSRSDAWLSFLMYSKFAVILIIAVQLGLVFAISALMNRLSAMAVKCLFVAYALSMGFTISIVLLAYSGPVIAKAFLSAAAVYAAMAVYGLATKRSLQAWGSFLFMGLIGVILSSVVNFFLGSAMLDFVICWAGVLVFAGLTAYDHQKLRVMYASSCEGDAYGEAAGPDDKLVTYGALTLYLDFVNLFLFLVRIFGRR